MPHNDPNPNFDAALDASLRGRGQADPPAGLEQRLAAVLRNAEAPARRPAKAKENRMATLVPSLPTPHFFASAEAMRGRRSPAGIWAAVGAHAVAVALIGIAVLAQTRDVIKPPVPVAAVTLTVPPPPLPAPPKAEVAGGGGGHRDLLPASAGHLPKLAPVQIVPPSVKPVIDAKLAVEPSITVDRDLKIADNTLPNIGAPNSSLKGMSLGSGSGTGLGAGDGSGFGPGSGGGTGGAIYHIGGGVLKPVLIYFIEPEFSEEARKRKFSGNVVVYLRVNEQGLPDHVRVARGVGMGLDEKAVEAVRQYRFKPATKDGKPVTVEFYVDVNFNIM